MSEVSAPLPPFAPNGYCPKHPLYPVECLVCALSAPCKFCGGDSRPCGWCDKPQSCTTCGITWTSTNPGQNMRSLKAHRKHCAG